MDFNEEIILDTEKIIQTYITKNNIAISNTKEIAINVLNVAYNIGCDFSETTIKRVIEGYFQNL